MNLDLAEFEKIVVTTINIDQVKQNCEIKMIREKKSTARF